MKLDLPAKSPITKALRVLAHIAKCHEAPTLADLTRSMRLPKATTYRLARSLEDEGYVCKDPLTQRYRVGSAFERIALHGLRNSSAHETRRALMSKLADQLGARVNLVVLKSGNLSFVQWVESLAPLRIDVSSDMPMPVHCSASGKLLVAFGPPQQREAVLRSAPFQGYTKRTITTARGFTRHLAVIRRQGYSADNQELIPGINCLAVPVFNRSGQVVAGLAVMAPVASLPLEKLKRYLPEIRACANFISRELGWEDTSRTTQRSKSNDRSSGSQRLRAAV